MDRLLKPMKLYKLTLKLGSPFASDWQADTIWGHLCWTLRFLRGEEALSGFIAAYRDGNPPLLVSNGFPGDLLPHPVLPEKSAETRHEFKVAKGQRKIRWLSTSEFNAVLKGEKPALLEKTGGIALSITLKNQINRLSGTTGGDESGSLINIKQYHGENISIYLKLADDFVDTAEELFCTLSKSGYGKRKTVGYGQFSVQSFAPFAGFAPPADANGFISLSNFVPAENDPSRGFWEVLVKYGRLGEEYALTGNPHKKPLVMFKAGSCFYDCPCRQYYGRLVMGLSLQYPQVAQYGCALPVPIKLPEN